MVLGKKLIGSAVLAASLGLATQSFAQTNTNKGDAGREKNAAPVAAPMTPAREGAPKATTGTETRSDPAAAGIGGRDKQTGAPKDKD